MSGTQDPQQQGEPDAAPPPGLPSGPGPLPGMPQAPQDLHDLQGQAKAHYDSMKKIAGRVGNMVDEFDKLAKLADTITPEDVMDGAAHLVGHGFDPMMLAGILADMPEVGGEALQGFIKGLDAKARAAQAQVQPALEAARHQMGVSALHSILGHQLAPPDQPAQASNPLIPQGG